MVSLTDYKFVFEPLTYLLHRQRQRLKEIAFEAEQDELMNDHQPS